MNKTFKACMTLIDKDRIGDRGEFMEKIDILLLNGRLSREEYSSLTKRLEKAGTQKDNFSTR